MHARVTRWLVAALLAAALGVGLLTPSPTRTVYGGEPTPTPTSSTNGEPGGSGGNGGG